MMYAHDERACDEVEEWSLSDLDQGLVIVGARVCATGFADREATRTPGGAYHDSTCRSDGSQEAACSRANLISQQEEE
jgi:hypothetical protein